MNTGLVELFAGRVWLVSTCGPTVQAKTLRWLEAHNFYLRTGVEPAAVRFCRARADKRGHCTDLALMHFIDDHPEVHALIRGTVDYQYFFGAQPGGVPGYGIHAPTWADVELLIKPTLRQASGPDDGLTATSAAAAGPDPVRDEPGDSHYHPGSG